MKKMISIAITALLTTMLIGCNENNVSVKPSEHELQVKETLNPSQSEVTLSPSQSEVTTALNDSSTSSSQNEKDFTSLELEITKGTLYIRTGDSFSLSRHDGYPVDYQISDHTLYFKNSDGKDVVLTLPEKESYETLRLITENAHVYGENSLTVQNLELTAVQGEVKLETVSVSQNSSIHIQQGSAFLSGDLGIAVTADCQEGHLNLELPFQQNDCNFEMTLTSGDIQLGEERYHKKSESWTVDNGGERSIKLICSTGDISVAFAQ